MKFENIKYTQLERHSTMRSTVVDAMKGLALLLMLVGHMRIPVYVYKFIYSFHMPLFFILSGYYAKSLQESGLTFTQVLKKDSMRLLLPFFITSLAIIAFTLLRAVAKQDWSIVIERAYSLFYVTHDAGPIWFLVALFWCRVIFRPLMKLGRWSLLISILISVAAILYAHHVTQLPFCILTALAAIVFYALGWWYKQYGAPKWFLIIAILCWPMVIIGPRVDLFFVNYGIYPITILGACGGTYVIYKLFALIEKTLDTSAHGDFLMRRGCRIMYDLILWCGINSLIILCFHTFDIYCCYVTMIMDGMFNIRLPYWPTQLIRDGLVFLLSWSYIKYFKPLMKNLKWK